MENRAKQHDSLITEIGLLLMSVPFPRTHFTGQDKLCLKLPENKLKWHNITSLNPKYAEILN